MRVLQQEEGSSDYIMAYLEIISLSVGLISGRIIEHKLTSPVIGIFKQEIGSWPLCFPLKKSANTTYP